MKPNFILSIASLTMAALITYLFYEIAGETDHTNRVLVLCISGFICMSATLMGAIGISYPDGKTALNIKTLSGYAVFLLLIVHIPMAIWLYNPALLVVPAGLILVGYLVVVNTILNHCE